MIDSWSNAIYALISRTGFSDPIHPALVHVPIGLVLGAFVFGWIGVIFRRERLVLSARDCLVLAFLSWFPAVFIGVMDWRHFYGGEWLAPIIIKMVLAGMLFVLLVIALNFGFKGKGSSRGALITYTLCVITIVLLGWLGARLIYSGTGMAQKTMSTYQAGEKIFSANCSSCHPHGGNVIKSDKPLRDAPQLKNLETFVALLRSPVAPMPPFAESQIPDSQAKKLYEYIINVLKQSDGSGAR